MLSKTENDQLTHTAPGTPTGDVLRRYWIPALLSWELPDNDCPPVRVQLLSEHLVAFRDSRGRLGMFEENCPHRLASMWLGRNEEEGLRCVYHGWKFDVSGNCVEMMNEPVGFENKVSIKSYPCIEIGQIIWTYMGPKDLQPPPPYFAWTQVPEPQRGVSKVHQECNWLHCFEGTMDTSHAPILHKRFGATGLLAEGGPPRIEVDILDYGYRYFSIRKGPEGTQFIKGYQFVMPWTQIRAGGDGSDGHYCVPIDDENCMVWNWVYRDDEPVQEHVRNGDIYGNGPGHVDQKTFMSFRNIRNDWQIDRDMQRTQNFTGITGTNTQDRAVQETMGRILDRSREHLGPADRQIIVARQLLQEALKAVHDGQSPRGADATYYNVRAFSATVPPDVPFRDVMDPEMNPKGPLQKAAASARG